MKKLGIVLAILLFLLAAAYAVMQGEIGRSLTRKIFTEALEDSGYQVHIDQIEGTLPNQIHLKGVAIDGKGIHATIATLSLRPVLWRLLKAEIAFTNIQAKEISISEGKPFDLTDGKFFITPRRVMMRGEILSWDLFVRYHFKTQEIEYSAVSDTMSAKGDANLLPKLSANLLVRSSYLLASLDVAQEGNAYQGKAVWQVLRTDQFGPFDGTAIGIYQDGKLQGQLTAGSFAKADFDLIRHVSGAITGMADLKIDNLQSLHIPDTYGKMQAKIVYDENLQIDATFSEFYYKDAYTQKLLAILNGDQLQMNAEKLHWNTLEADTAALETAIKENSPYTFSAKGSLRHPFEINSRGNWSKTTLQINTLSGTFLDSPFALNEPIQVTNTETEFRLPNARLSIGEGTMQIDIDRKNDSTAASLHLVEIPTDLLSFNPLEVAVQGALTLDAELQEKNNRLTGQFKAILNQVEPVPAIGQFEGTFNKSHLLVNGSLVTGENPLLKLDLSLPIHLSIWPFTAEILYHKDARGQISFDGQVEEILDYFDLGASRLEGRLKGALTFRGNLYRPLVEGKFALENGLYENYYTGTQLRNMTAELIADKNSIFLRSLTAIDNPGTGTFQASGELKLLKSDYYPFRVDTDIQNLQFTEIDLVKASATGKVRLEGNSLSSIAGGDIHIHNCDLTIPDHIPKPLPHLDVIYRNAIHPVEPPQKEYKPYPIHLDLNIAAPADITISGRGLESSWKGDFHLGGTYTSLAAKGKLELIEGAFKFSSREFKLVEGALIFSGIEHQMPYLNLAAQMETKGITITARLKGPIDDPQLTLLSNPPLPLGSIMSYLLFGQDISEIGGFQALQLASSLASLAGTGPDVMEATRKSLGVDRLRVVSEPSDEGGETVALQVGKYISKGVLVSFTQGTEDSSTNISVEIELKNNFIFQIESDQRQEQGKFTLKWNLNY